MLVAATTPSVEDGLPKQVEINQRRTTCAFMQDAGMKLRLPQLSIATGIVFFHKFYDRHSLKEYDRYAIATTCLFLAGKVEETPKKLKDVILVTYQIRHKEELKPQSQEFWEIRDQILLFERIVLQTIAFDLTVEHPYKFLLTYVKTISGDRNLAQVAWNFVNDSLRTTLCLQYKPQLIALATIYLASRLIDYELPPGPGGRPWWEGLGARKEELDHISSQILDLYESYPNVNAMKREDGGETTGRAAAPASTTGGAHSPQMSPEESLKASVGQSGLLGSPTQGRHANYTHVGTVSPAPRSPSSHSEKIQTDESFEEKARERRLDYRRAARAGTLGNLVKAFPVQLTASL
jgi:transcription initiation factor TFIIIB Brf1 subunit/transcription initiation factor TFIIB